MASTGSPAEIKPNTDSIRVSLAGEITLEASRLVGEEGLSGRRGRLAFAFLVLERGRAIPRGELAAALWGDRLPASWAPSLREVMSDVRVFLDAAGLPGQEVLVSVQGCYRFDPPSEVEVDYESAERALALAEKLAIQGELEQASVAARTAAETLGRPLLPGLDGEWLESWRREFESAHSRSLLLLAEAASEGSPSTAIPAARKAIELNPFSDRAHLALIGAQLASGNRAEALRSYEGYRRLMATELGVGPSAEVEYRFREMLEDGAGDRPLTKVEVVGRDREQQMIETLLDEVGEGQGRSLFFAGDEGSGRSLMLRMVQQMAVARGIEVLRGRVDEARPSSLGLLQNAIGGHLTGDFKSTAGDPALLAVAFAETIRQRAAGQLLILIFDDLQLADSSSLAVLKTMAAEDLVPEGVLIAGSFLTTNDQEGSELEGFNRSESSQVLALEPLDPEALEELAELAGIPGIGKLLLEEVGGNPLHVVEALRHLKEVGSSGRELTAAKVPFGALALPPNLDELIYGRFSRLPQASRQLLETVAVIGGKVDFELAARLTGWSRREVGIALEQATEAGIVSFDEREPTRIRFNNEAYRRSVLERMPEGRLRRRHAAAATALESLGGVGRETLAGQWADSGEATERGAGHARAAGDRALADADYGEAITWFSSALNQLPDEGADSEARRELLISLADALKLGGDVALAENRYLEAAELARLTGNPDDLAEVAIAFAGFNRFEPSISPASMLLLEEAAAASDLSEEMSVKLLGRRAQFSGAMGEGEEFRQSTADALASLGEEKREAKIHALAARLHVLGGPEHASERLLIADSLSEIALSEGEIEPELTAIEHRIWALAELGDHRRASVEIDRFSGLASRLRIPVIEMFAAQHGTYLAMIEGRFSEVESFADRVAEAASRSADPRMAASSKVLTQLVPRWLQGSFSTLAPAIEAVFTWQPDMESFAATWSLALLETGRRAEAIEVFEAQVAAGCPRPEPHGSLWSFDFFFHAVIAKALGHPAAAQIYEVGLPYSGMHCVYRGMVFCGAYDHHLGRLSLVTGDHDKARLHLEAAMTDYQAMGALPWLELVRSDLVDLNQ